MIGAGAEAARRPGRRGPHGGRQHGALGRHQGRHQVQYSPLIGWLQPILTSYWLSGRGWTATCRSWWWRSPTSPPSPWTGSTPTSTGPARTGIIQTIVYTLIAMIEQILNRKNEMHFLVHPSLSLLSFKCMILGTCRWILPCSYLILFKVLFSERKLA